MQAIVCDRCGEVMKGRSSNPVVRNLKRNWNTGDVASYNGSTYFDLCGNCMNEFYIFMKGDKADEDKDQLDR